MGVLRYSSDRKARKRLTELPKLVQHPKDTPKRKAMLQAMTLSFEPTTSKEKDEAAVEVDEDEGWSRDKPSVHKILAIIRRTEAAAEKVREKHTLCREM